MRKLSKAQKELLIKASREKVIQQSDCRTAYSLEKNGFLEFAGGAASNRPASLFRITESGANHVANNYQQTRADESEQGGAE